MRCTCVAYAYACQQCTIFITGLPTYSVGGSIVLLAVRLSSFVVVVCRRL